MQVLLRVCESACVYSTPRTETHQPSTSFRQSRIHAMFPVKKKEKTRCVSRGGRVGGVWAKGDLQLRCGAFIRVTEPRNVPPDAHCTPPASHPLHVHSSALLRGQERVKTHHARTSKKKKKTPLTPAQRLSPKSRFNPSYTPNFGTGVRMSTSVSFSSSGV